MFDIGFWELFLILVLALVVIGPERLPGAARTLGYWIGRGRRFIEGVKTDVEQDLDVAEFKRLMHNQEVQINELRQKLANAGDLSGDDQAEHRYKSDSSDGYEILEEGSDDDAPDAGVIEEIHQEEAGQQRQAAEAPAGKER